MGSREEFLSCGRWAVRGSLILEQSAIPSPGVPSLPSEYAFLVHPPPREAALLGENFFFLFFLILSLIQFVEQIRKRWYLCLDISSCPKNISQCEYEVHVLEHEDGVKKI